MRIAYPEKLKIFPVDGANKDGGQRLLRKIL